VPSVGAGIVENNVHDEDLTNMLVGSGPLSVRDRFHTMATRNDATRSVPHRTSSRPFQPLSASASPEGRHGEGLPGDSAGGTGIPEFSNVDSGSAFEFLSGGPEVGYDDDYVLNYGYGNSRSNGNWFGRALRLPFGIVLPPLNLYVRTSASRSFR